jgi:hypothetical protein
MGISEGLGLQYLAENTCSVIPIAAKLWVTILDRTHKFYRLPLLREYQVS